LPRRGLCAPPDQLSDFLAVLAPGLLASFCFFVAGAFVAPAFAAPAFARVGAFAPLAALAREAVARLDVGLEAARLLAPAAMALGPSFATTPCSSTSERSSSSRRRRSSSMSAVDGRFMVASALCRLLSRL